MSLAPRTTDRRAGGRTLDDVLRGQMIRRVETDVRVHGTAFGTELELDSHDILGVCVAMVDPAVTRETGERATLCWRFLPQPRRRLILSPGAGPHVIRYARGDGSAIQQELTEKLRGQRFAAIESGAVTEEGAAVTRLRFVSGDQALVFPLPTSIGWVPTWQLPRRAAYLITPGLGRLGR